MGWPLQVPKGPAKSKQTQSHLLRNVCLFCLVLFCFPGIFRYESSNCVIRLSAWVISKLYSPHFSQLQMAIYCIEETVSSEWKSLWGKSYLTKTEATIIPELLSTNIALLKWESVNLCSMSENTILYVAEFSETFISDFSGVWVSSSSVSLLSRWFTNPMVMYNGFCTGDG